MQKNIKTSLHNRFDFEVADAETGVIKQRATSYNIILDQYFTRLMSRSSKLTYMHVGTGSGTPDQTRTSPFAYLGAKQAVTVETVKAYPTSFIRKKIVLLPGDFVGKRITEVGFAYSYSNGTGVVTSPYLTTHSTLKDSEGNPIAIEKTATDVITIYGTFYMTMGQPEDDSFVLPNPETSYVIRGVLQDDYSTTAPSVVAGLYASFDEADGITDKPLFTKNNIFPTGDTVNKKWIFPTTRFDYNEANGHYVSSIGIPTVAVWKLPNSVTFPSVLLSNIAVGTGDGVKTEFDCPIPKLVTGSDVVRKNGVILERDTDYTIDYDNNALGLPELFTCAEKASFDPLISVKYGYTWMGHSKYPLIYPSNEYFDTENRYKVPIRIENVYDFQETKAFNTLLLLPEGIMCFNDSVPTGSFKVRVEHSIDNQVWATALTTEACPISSRYIVSERKLIRFPMVEARYIRFSILKEDDSISTEFCITSRDNGSLMVGYTTPGISFTTAPADGDILTMDCQIDRPFKNENWVLDFGCSVSFERA